MSYHRRMRAGSSPSLARLVTFFALGCVLAPSARAGAQDTSGSAEIESDASAPTASERAERTETAPVAAATSVDGPGGELDASVRSGPPFGSREAVRQSEPMAMRRVGQPDAVDPELPVALSFFGTVGVVMPSSYDDAIQSHSYGPSSPNVSFDASLTYGVARWLHLGGRIGARGRGWLRRDGDFGMAMGIDALAIATGRVHLGPVVDIGITLGGGVGMAGLSVHRSTLLGVAPRLHGSLQIGFRLLRGFHIFIRGAWDYFPWNDIDRGGYDIDLGGPYVGIGIEVKT